MRIQMSTFGIVATLLLAAGCTSDAGPGAVDGTPVPSPSPTLAATAPPAITPSRSPTPTATEPPARTPSLTPSQTLIPDPPYRVTFARGETIDVSPAVVFADLGTLEAEAWVVPGADGEFVVSPAGSYVIYRTGDGFKLLRTQDGSVNSLRISEWPVEIGPGDSGFIARDEERFVGSTFTGSGERIRDLWLSVSDEPLIAAWAPDGQAVAISQINRLSVWPQLDSPTPQTSFHFSGSSLTRPSLEWSPDSERLVLVTADAVRVFDRERTLLWTVEGEFTGDPRWSTDGAYLTVSAMPEVAGRYGSEVGIAPITYLLTRDGAEVLRVTGAGSCGVNPWLNASSFTAGRYLITTAGDLDQYGGRIPEIWYGPDEFGLELAPALGFHLPHIASRTSGQLLEDGRLVFTTPEIGHGGCATIVGASEWPAIAIERPPYGPLRSARAVASDLLAGHPDVLRVVDAVLDAREDGQVDALLALAHRYEALCSFHGGLFEHCADAGLGIYDTFPGLPLSILGCEACYLPVEEAERALAPLTEGSALELGAVWETGPFLFWPYTEFEDAERRLAIWFVREDQRRLGQDDPLGALLLVVPGAERPIVAVELALAPWTGHRTAGQFGNWELLYLAPPVIAMD